MHTIFAADINRDGYIEILVGTDNRDLIAFTPDLHDKAEWTTIEPNGPNVLWYYQLDKRPLTLCVDDIDGDGLQEILVGAEDKHIYLIDERGKLIWRHHHQARIFSLHVKDIDKDGSKEILIGSDDNKIHVCRFNLSNANTGNKYLEKAIRQAHSYAKKHHPDDLGLLTPAERELLADILNIRDVSPRSITFNGARRKLAQKQYLSALQAFLQLEQNKVQLRWAKCTNGHIHSLAFGNISGDTRQEIIVVETSDGFLEAFDYAGAYLWHMDRQIRAMQQSNSENEQRKEIFVNLLDNHVHAYTQEGKHLWIYKTYDRVRDVCIHDIDNDGSVEVIVGSEDRNVYVIHANGTLRWRYFFPHNILSLGHADVDNNKLHEILIGCADGYMYVFSCDGDMLWKYKGPDRIRALCVQDINNDKMLEVAIGSEDRLELLQIIDQDSLHLLIERCWLSLQQEQQTLNLIDDLLHHPQPTMRAFALRQMVEHVQLTPSDFPLLQQLLKDEVIVRKALIYTIMSCYEKLT